MTHAFLKHVGTSVIAAAVVGGVAMAALGETPVGKTIESRVLLGFQVAPEAVGAYLPEGWAPVILPAGPVAGSNLILVLMDRHVRLDPDGQPQVPFSGPAAALFAYARKDGVEGLRGFVIRTFEEPPVVDPYGNAASADLSRESCYYDAGGGVRTINENWMIWPDEGGEITISLGVTGVGLGWSSGESRPYSSVDPEFFRIYRYEQVGGLAMNTAMGMELDGTVSFASTVPSLAGLFDGKTDPVAVVTIPTYIREIALP